MNDDFELKFKDKEIERVTSELTKSGKQQFGASFKNAIELMPSKEELEQSEAVAPIQEITNVKSTPTENPNAVEKPDLAEIQPKPTSSFGTISIPADEEKPEGVFGPGITLSEDAAKKELYSIVKPLRTYERDIAEAIRSKNESVTSINLANQKKREDEAKKSPVPQQVHKAAEKGLVVLVSIVLLFAGVGIISFIFYYLSAQPEPIVFTIPTLISTDRQYELEIDSRNPAAALLLVQSALRGVVEQNDLATIHIFETIESTGIENSTGGSPSNNKNSISPRTIQRPLLVESFFDLFAKNAPTSLIRALGKEWLFGFQNIRDINEPFIFLTIAEFSNTFDGMLRWEDKIYEDFRAISNLSTPSEQTPIMSVSTSTPISTGPVGKFEDLVIRNKDTRVLRDNLGAIVLVYSFLDEKHLVITPKEETFREILNRFFSSQVVR